MEWELISSNSMASELLPLKNGSESTSKRHSHINFYRYLFLAIFACPPGVVRTSFPLSPGMPGYQCLNRMSDTDLFT